LKITADFVQVHQNLADGEQTDADDDQIIRQGSMRQGKT
jgi:hypothetical protein